MPLALYQQDEKGLPKYRRGGRPCPPGTTLSARDDPVRPYLVLDVTLGL